MKSKILQFVSISLIGSMLFLTGCQKDKTDTTPQLPPLTSLSIDMQSFSATAKKDAGTFNNFLLAAASTMYWNSVLTVYLAVPVASYAEAFNHEVQRVDNNTFLWSYDVVVNDTTYTANLYGKVDGNMINFEMHLSQHDGFQDFIWYTGSCNVQRTTGEWTIMDNPTSNTPWISIAWNHDYVKKTFDIQYTNTYPSSDYEDSYIKYGIQNDSPFNAYYNIYDSKVDETYAINFNTTTHEGQIYYNSAWHCWDSNLQDMDCSQ